VSRDDTDALSFRVAQHIRQRLLRYSINVWFDFCGQPMRFHALAVKIHRHSIMFGPFAGVAPQGHVQPEVIPGRPGATPKPGDECPASGCRPVFPTDRCWPELAAKNVLCFLNICRPNFNAVSLDPTDHEVRARCGPFGFLGLTRRRCKSKCASSMRLRSVMSRAAANTPCISRPRCDRPRRYTTREGCGGNMADRQRIIRTSPSAMTF